MNEKLYTKNGYPARILGRTGRKVSIIAFGGIVVMDETQDSADKITAEAVEAGINYFDVAPTYGNAQDRLGVALEPFRKNVFLACKTTQRDAAEAKKELENSLNVLRTDYFDLYQLHGIADVQKDVEAVFAKGGAMETMVAAKKAGKIKNIGFSTHSAEAGLEALRRFDFDTVMMGVNFVCHYNKKFETKVLNEAKNRNLGIIALKSLAKTAPDDKKKLKKFPKCWYVPIDEPKLAKKAIAWTLDQQVSTLIPPGHYELFKMAMELGRDYREEPEHWNAEELNAFAQKQEPVFPVRQ